MIEALVGLIVIAVLGAVAVGLVFALIGLVIGLAVTAAVLAGKVAVVFLLAWGAMKLFQRLSGPRVGTLSSADTRWLDS